MRIFSSIFLLYFPVNQGGSNRSGETIVYVNDSDAGSTTV